uniref:Uncharacterized protein n=1 Tax=Falco tinnunculus TaxID=100819 RepID=A0A8C4U2V7_FALTI
MGSAEGYKTRQRSRGERVLLEQVIPYCTIVTISWGLELSDEETNNNLTSCTIISYQPQGDKAIFFRMVFSAPATRKPDVDFLLEETERPGKDL